MPKQEALENGTLVSLTPQEAKERFDANQIVIIDVRTPVEYAFEHIPGALLFPMSAFDPAKLPSGGKPVVFHCGSGKRSTAVAKKCIAHGIAEVTHVEGGLEAWKKAGLKFAALDPMTGHMMEKAMPV
jgi:rhodanese-related sulfurtransferase